MLLGMLMLIFFQLLGFIAVSALAIPIPSQVAGLILLFAYLLIRGQITDSLVKITSALLPMLPLFLIPASAGVMQYGHLLKQDWFAISIALIVSLLLSILVIPFVFLFFTRLFGKQE